MLALEALRCGANGGVAIVPKAGARAAIARAFAA